MFMTTVGGRSAYHPSCLSLTLVDPRAHGSCAKEARLRRVTTCLVMVLLAFAVWGTTGPATCGNVYQRAARNPPRPIFARFHCIRYNQLPRCFPPRREACWATEHAVPEWIITRLQPGTNTTARRRRRSKKMQARLGSQ